MKKKEKTKTKKQEDGNFIMFILLLWNTLQPTQAFLGLSQKFSCMLRKNFCDKPKNVCF